MHGYDSHPIGAIQGVSLPFDLARREQRTESVCLPSHRLVGELSHPVELLLHLVFSALTPTGENIPHYFSQHNGPCSTGAQRKFQAAIFLFPHRRAADAENASHGYIFSNNISFYIFICPAACAGMLERFTAGTHRQRATAATSSGCAAKQCGKCRKSWLTLN